MEHETRRIGIAWTTPKAQAKAMRTASRKRLRPPIGLCIFFLTVAVVSFLLTTTTLSAVAAPLLEGTVTNTARLAEPLRIDLIEPAWDHAVDADEDGVPDCAQAVFPLQCIPKDPHAVNVSGIDAWVYLSVSTPVASVRTSLGSTASDRQPCELYAYNSDQECWKLLGVRTNDDRSVERLYAYHTIVPSNTTTEPLFEEIQLANIVDGDLAETRAQDVVVTAHGIQARGFEDAASAWRAYEMQTEIAPFTFEETSTEIESE